MDRCWRLSTWSHTLISLELSITMYKNPRTSHINMSLYPRSNFRILLLCTYQWKPSSSMELRNSTSVTWGACQLCERAPWCHWFPLVCAGQQDPGTGDIFMTSVVMVSKFYFFSDFDRYWAGRPLTGILLETRFICRKRSLKLHVKYGLSQKPLIPTGQTIFDTELPQYVIWEHFCQKLYPNIIINQWSFKVKFVSLLLVMSI